MHSETCAAKCIDMHLNDGPYCTRGDESVDWSSLRKDCLGRIHFICLWLRPCKNYRFKSEFQNPQLRPRESVTWSYSCAGAQRRNAFTKSTYYMPWFKQLYCGINSVSQSQAWISGGNAILKQQKMMLSSKKQLYLQNVMASLAHTRLLLTPWFSLLGLDFPFIVHFNASFGFFS